MIKEVLAFNRWSTRGIIVGDPGLKDYITLEARFAPKTGAKYVGSRFHKSRVFIVERFLNKIMCPGHKAKKHFKSSGYITGKAHKAYTMMEAVLEKLEKRTNKNPIEVLVKAIENAAPREEIITI